MSNTSVKPLSVLNIRDVPREVKNNFHAVCILEKTTMKDKILTFMKEYTEEHEK